MRRRALRSAIEIPNQWARRHYQDALWRYFNGPPGKPESYHNKRALCFCHRRWGKDSTAVNLMAVSAMLWPGNYAYMFPTANQGRSALWDNFDIRRGANMMELAFPEEIRRRTNHQQMFIELRNGSTIQVVGSDNYNHLVGTNYFGIVFSEWALSDPESWAYMRPILTENQGWALFITTPRGKNHAHEMWLAAKSEPEHWYTELSTVDDSGIIPNERLEVDHREYAKLYGEIQGEAFFRQEFFCDFESPILGAVYADALRYLETEGRVCPLKVEPGIKVHTAWDLGYSDATAIWFIQCMGRTYHLIGYYESFGAPLSHYVEKLNELKFTNKWLYGSHYLPHDVKAHELNTGMSRLQTLEALGIEPEVVPPHHLLDGINATRRVLDRCKIDPTRCAAGLDALKNYRYEWRDKHRIWAPHPRHDWASHGADALRTWATGFADPSFAAEHAKRIRRTEPAPPTGSQWVG
jgi:phage terminase large subunit